MRDTTAHDRQQSRTFSETSTNPTSAVSFCFYIYLFFH